jgi:guanosine-diphosphatase
VDDEDIPVTGTSPHDPLSDEAQGAADAAEDFTEIDDQVEEAPTGLPTSFETDPDPASTMICVEAFSPTKPLVQYALTIDAGSTGSRIHVYKFNNCGPSPQLEYETFLSINPGLSAYARDPTAAAASLDPLMEEANRVVPREMWKCTPVEVKATAGLRLLGAKESEAILDEVRNRLETNYDYVVGANRAVEIMDGKEEGVYAWITANYLLNKIGEGAKSTDTMAVMDLGGASTQIVFEPTFPASSKETIAEGEHKYLLNFGGKTFTLYQHSYLGYGLMRARRSVHNLVAFTWSFGQSDVEWDSLSEEIEMPNPCLSKGTTRRVELDPPGRKAVNVTMHGAMGGFESCNRIVELVMAKDA